MTIDGVWIGNRIIGHLLNGTTRNFEVHYSTYIVLQFAVLSPGNGFQRRSFLNFGVHVLIGRRLSHN
jgi:hypothetical protein